MIPNHMESRLSSHPIIRTHEPAMTGNDPYFISVDGTRTGNEHDHANSTVPSPKEVFRRSRWVCFSLACLDIVQDRREKYLSI